MDREALLRQLEREQFARSETEEILERITLELHRSNQTLQGYLHENESLLTQYKKAVDEGTIVSKTDKRGIIIYVNDEFCRISGYAREELIGKSHNIVRHMEMPKEAFKDMWSRLKAHKSWKGTVKNRAKDGTAYIVKATITPILDMNDDVQEYIAIREDITEVYNLQNEIIETQKEMLERLGDLAETRSEETGRHVHRVAEYSALLARYYGLDEKEISLIKMASPMHDIGKIAIPDSVLLKPGRLDKEEFAIMKTHAEKGYEVFKTSKRDLLQAASIIAYEHHERWDGEGYPRQLKGEDIHLYGRITAIADVFDALGTERVYKEAWPLEKILELFKEEQGKQFDPQLIELFFENIEAFLEIRNQFS